MYNSSNIILTPLEQRYLSTCYPLPDRPFYDEVSKWKEFLRWNSIEDKDLELSDELLRVFPHIGRLYMNGLFNRRSIQSYFEGIDLDSHNMRMYLFAKRAARNIPPDILSSILSHVKTCSVKPADMSTSTIWSYDGVYHGEIDLSYFNLTLGGFYVFVHGANGSDIDIAIRQITKEEFDLLRNWYEERQKSKENPFLRYSHYL